MEQPFLSRFERKNELSQDACHSSACTQVQGSKYASVRVSHADGLLTTFVCWETETQRDEATEGKPPSQETTKLVFYPRYVCTESHVLLLCYTQWVLKT